MTLPDGKVMVLGGGGFIGSSMVRRLLDIGYPASDVIAIDLKFPSFRWHAFGSALTLRSDLRDRAMTRWLFEHYQPKMVFQFAADMGGVEYFHSTHDWAAAIDNGLINHNVLTTINEDARVLFTSTACAAATEFQTRAYMDTHGVAAPAIVEEDILWGTPDQLYGQEKRHSALMYLSAPISARVCLLHTVYGKMQEHAGIRMKFPSAIAMKARAARSSGVLPILGDGRQIRSFLYIDDAIDRLIALASLDEDPGVVNIGSSVPLSVTEAAEQAVLAACPTRDVTLTYVDGPTGVEARNCNNRKAREVFGDELIDNVIPWADGISRMIDWLDEIDGVA